MFYYIPLLYLFRTRLKGMFSKIAWISTYLIPVAITFYLLGEKDVLLYVFIILTTFSAYELGYIYNDLELIKREINPTIRVTEEERIFYERNKMNIYVSRFFVLIILLLLSLLLFNDDFLFLLLNSLTILLVYVVYNSIRNELNIVLYSILLMLKYFGFFIFKHFYFELITVFFLLYPLCSTIDFASKNRFFTSKYIKMTSFDKFRFYYYLVINILIYILFRDSEYYSLYLCLGLYLLVYRTLIYLFLSKKLR